MDTQKLKEKILEIIRKGRNLGEYAGGSGHLSYRSLGNVEMEVPREVTFKNKTCYEIMVSYRIYTESEFSYATDDDEEDDYLTEKYLEKYIVDNEYNILEIQDLG